MTTYSAQYKLFMHTSKYSQRMRRLSCKIFNDFYIPELSKKDMDYGPYHPPVVEWRSKWVNDARAYERNQDKPLDLDANRNIKYYPAHPQIRGLTNQLREYGLFRDEHRDFNEEMKAIAISRGRVFRQRRGPNVKDKKK